MKIKLCAFADESGTALDTQIENLKKNNVYALELRSVNNVNVGDLTAEQATEIYDKLNENGIEVWSLGSPLGKIDLDKPSQEHYALLERLIATAKIMHTERIRMFSYFVPREGYPSAESEVIARLKKMTERAAKDGIKLCHENESAIFGATVDNCVKLYDAIPALNPVYDPANFLMWDENIGYALEKLYDRTYYFHIKDVIAAEKLIVPSGYGDGRINEMVGKLNRDATFTIEPHLHAFVGYSDIDKKELKNKFAFPDQPTAFKAAVDAFKAIMKSNGYVEGDKGIWTK